MPLMRYHARAFLVATVAALVVDALLLAAEWFCALSNARTVYVYAVAGTSGP